MMLAAAGASLRRAEPTRIGHGLPEGYASPGDGIAFSIRARSQDRSSGERKEVAIALAWR